MERKLSSNSAARIVRTEATEPAIYESPNSKNDLCRGRLRPDPSEDECGTIPLRKKSKPVPDDCSASLSRLESKRGQQQQQLQHQSPAVYISPTSHHKR